MKKDCTLIVTEEYVFSLEDSIQKTKSKVTKIILRNLIQNLSKKLKFALLKTTTQTTT